MTAGAVAGWTVPHVRGDGLLIAAMVGVALAGVGLLADGVRIGDTRDVRLGLLLLLVTALPPAARGNLGPVAASLLGLALFVTAHLAYSACATSDLRAEYAGGEAPPRGWLPVGAVLLGSAIADLALFAAVSAGGTSLRGLPVLAAVGTLCVLAIAGLVWALATRVPPAD